MGILTTLLKNKEMFRMVRTSYSEPIVLLLQVRCEINFVFKEMKQNYIRIFYKNVRIITLGKYPSYKNWNVWWKTPPNLSNMYFSLFFSKNVWWKICSETYFIKHHQTWFFLLFWKNWKFSPYTNRSNISSNIEIYWCLMKCLIGLRPPLYTMFQFKVLNLIWMTETV